VQNADEGRSKRTVAVSRRHSWTLRKQRNLFFYTTVGNLWIEAVVTVAECSSALLYR